MKRGIQIFILLLMVATSLNAGTLAIYTSTVDLDVLPVSAKRFALGVNEGGQSEFDLRIAPGELVSYNFDVSNTKVSGGVSEVDMDLLVQADFSAILNNIPGIKIQLLVYGASSYELATDVGSDGILNYQMQNMFTANQQEEKQFSLTFYWENGERAHALISGSRIILPLTLYVKGEQHV